MGLKIYNVIASLNREAYIISEIIVNSKIENAEDASKIYRSGAMKPLAFCMHHNFTNIQQPPSSSRSKTRGKSHDFDIDFGINFCCTAVEVTEVISKQVLVCLFCKGKLF